MVTQCLLNVTKLSAAGLQPPAKRQTERIKRGKRLNLSFEYLRVAGVAVEKLIFAAPTCTMSGTVSVQRQANESAHALKRFFFN